VARRATVIWQAPPPASVNEELVLYDDGGAWLVVRRPRQGRPDIGTWVGRPTSEDATTLADATDGSDPIVIDVIPHEPDPRLAPLAAAADRIAATVRPTPRAVATFRAQPLQRQGDRLTVLLVVVGSGEVPVQFDLEPDRCAVHWERDGRPLSWVDLPPPATGFVTSTAEGLGGLNRRAVVAPGAFGALSVEVEVPVGATGVSFQVAGWLSEALPDDADPARYEIRTAVAAIPSA
jgi:hypothetical protein